MKSLFAIPLVLVATLPAQNLSGTRKAILDLFKNLPAQNRVLYAQNIGHGREATSQYQTLVSDQLSRFGGARPALLGADYGYSKIDSNGIRAVNEVLTRHWEEGGLVTLSAHLPNPYDETPGGGSVKRKTRNGHAAILQEGTAPNLRQMAALELIGKGLLELQSRHIVVLWRPYHEINNMVWWWAHSSNADGRCTPREQVVGLWLQMHRVFTKMGIENLIWVYNAVIQWDTNKIPAADYYYPDNVQIDLVGLDWYQDSMNRPLDTALLQSVEALMKKGKPFAFNEFGPWKRKLKNNRLDAMECLNMMRNDFPQACYFMFWQNWQEPNGEINCYALPNLEHAEEFIHDERVITLKPGGTPLWKAPL